ncbi:hypothetical protein MHK_010328 [Candidatus Magnetomorum sp. HK-1]|nr:hypothetical protein MHK_010328 [Candidatus Magnetomorum sp. HK-1]
MNIEKLTEITPDLSKMPEKAISELSEKMDLLLAEMNEIMCKRPDVKSLVGEDNIQMMKDNHANHLRFVYSLLKQYNKKVLVDTVCWVYRSYRSRGFHVNYWAAQINTWIEIFKKHLSNTTYEAISPLYEWFSITIPHFSNLSDEELSNAQISVSCDKET